MKSLDMVQIFTFILFFFLLSPMVLAEKLHPPREKPSQGGVNFTVGGIDNVLDLHGEIENPDLVIFFGGNQFMVLPEIMEAFRAEYSQYERIFFETLPPGIIERQVDSKNLVMGNLKITHKPDLFVAGEERLRRMDDHKKAFTSIRPYHQNLLAIMVHEGNPKGIQSLGDLGREDVAVSMPNPETEGIAQKAQSEGPPSLCPNTYFVHLKVL